MAVDERMIGEALRAMAARATPVDPGLLSRRALRGRVRQRRTRWVVGVAVAAAVAAGVTVEVRHLDRQETISPMDPGRAEPLYPTPTPTPVITGAPALGPLPANDGERYAQVLACMPKGGTVHNMDGDRVLPQHGRSQDFRYLVEVADKGGVTRLMGSLKGFVLCTPAVRLVSYATDPLFTYWGHEAPGKIEFAGPMSVDVYDEQRPGMVNPPKEGDPAYLVVAGRVTAEVARVEVEWAGGLRADAALSGGFFLARKPGPAHGQPPVVRSVTAYDRAGQVIATHGAIKWPELGTGARDEDD